MVSKYQWGRDVNTACVCVIMPCWGRPQIPTVWDVFFWFSGFICFQSFTSLVSYRIMLYARNGSASVTQQSEILGICLVLLNKNPERSQCAFLLAAVRPCYNDRNGRTPFKYQINSKLNFLAVQATLRITCNYPWQTGYAAPVSLCSQYSHYRDLLTAFAGYNSYLIKTVQFLLLFLLLWLIRIFFFVPRLMRILHLNVLCVCGKTLPEHLK